MNQPPKRSGKGCLVYGCLSVVVLCIAGILALYFGGRYAINSAIQSYTSATPAALPKSEMTDEQYAGFLNRATNFSNALTQHVGGTALSLTLTADEINAWMQREPGNTGSNGRAFLQLDGEQIEGVVSLPLDEIGWEKLKGRYLNGTGGFNVGLTNGTLDIRLRSLTVNGRALPKSFLASMQTENLADGFNIGSNKPAWWALLESVEVTNSTVIIKARSPDNLPEAVNPVAPKNP